MHFYSLTLLRQILVHHYSDRGTNFPYLAHHLLHLHDYLGRPSGDIGVVLVSTEPRISRSLRCGAVHARL